MTDLYSAPPRVHRERDRAVCHDAAAPMAAWQIGQNAGLALESCAPASSNDYQRASL